MNLLGMTRPEICDAISSTIGLEPYRAKQIFSWLHTRGCTDFSDMTNLSKAVRSELHEYFSAETGAIATKQNSADGTVKWLVRFTPDNRTAEAVFIPEADRGTLCVSSQAGCALACRFCHTGSSGFGRHLTAAEIVGQLHIARQALGDLPLDPKRKRQVSNIVFMGEGEPLLNYRAVSRALHIMTDGAGPKIAGRRITVSTSGIIPAIKRLGSEHPTVNLAISLHATTNEARTALMPINRSNPLEPLLRACREFSRGVPRAENLKRRRRRITFEYVMLEGVNDSDADAERLLRLVGNMPSLVNLIPFNPWPGAPYRASSRATIERFAKKLESKGQYVTVRWSRGDDILAACGQLSGKLSDSCMSSNTAVSRLMDEFDLEVRAKASERKM